MLGVGPRQPINRLIIIWIWGTTPKYAYPPGPMALRSGLEYLTQHFQLLCCIWSQGEWKILSVPWLAKTWFSRRVAELLFSSLLPYKAYFPHSYIAAPSASSKRPRIWKLPPWIKKIGICNFLVENPDLFQETTLSKIRCLNTPFATSFSRAHWTVETDRLHGQPGSKTFQIFGSVKRTKGWTEAVRLWFQEAGRLLYLFKTRFLRPGDSPQPV